MLVVSPIWLIPRPVLAYVQPLQETNSVVETIPPANDGSGILQPEQNVQPSDVKQIQKVDVPTKNISGTRPPNRRSVGKSGSGDSGRNYSVEEVKALIISYSAAYGIESEAPLCIAEKESNDSPYSKNKSSTASGVFQYLSGTWRATDEGKAGLSVFDADSNVKAAIKYMAIHRSTKPWTVAKNCPELTFIDG